MGSKATKRGNEDGATRSRCLFRTIVPRSRQDRAPRGCHGEIQRIGAAGEQIDTCDPPRQRGRVEKRGATSSWPGSVANLFLQSMYECPRAAMPHDMALKGGKEEEPVAERIVDGKVVEDRAGVLRGQ